MGKVKGEIYDSRERVQRENSYMIDPRQSIPSCSVCVRSIDPIESQIKKPIMQLCESLWRTLLKIL